MGGESKSPITYNVYNYYNIGTLKMRKGESVKEIQDFNNLDSNSESKTSVESSPRAIEQKSVATSIVAKNDDNKIESQYMTTLCGVLCLVLPLSYSDFLIWALILKRLLDCTYEHKLG